MGDKLATGWADERAKERTKTGPKDRKRICFSCGRSHEADGEYDACRNRWMDKMEVERGQANEEDFLP